MSDVFGKRLGQYILLEQLGEGGMAKVYNAFDSRTERNVAIKVILPSKRSSQVFIQQFEQEAKSLANLIHTNIVKVLNYGIEDGQPYLVMEFVPGGTLKEAMQRPISWQTAAAILAPVARALEYVHHQQIVHRDVKPSNILLDEDFHPMLSDFGIVKLLESKEETNNAAIGVGVGTPDYMSPEQGMGKDVDFRADIYSLGLVFYEMVTGKKPFAADTPMAAVIKHITEEVDLPSTVDKNIPKFVESAMLRAIEKNPEDRYSSMGEFANALELIALGKDAPAKEILKLSQKPVRKVKIGSKYLLVLLIPLLFGLSYLAYQYWNGRGAKPANLPTVSPTITATIKSPATKLPTKPVQATQMPPTAPVATAVNPGEPPASDPASGVTLLGTPLDQYSNPGPREIARWGTGGVNVVKWSPDGRLIALGTTSGIFLYDAQSKELVRFIDTGFDVIQLTFSPDGNFILSGSLQGHVELWGTQDGKLSRDLGAVGSTVAVTAMTYSSNGKNVAIGYKNGTIQYVQIGQTNPLTLFQPTTVDALAISADNRLLYVSNGENKIVVWDIALKKVDSELSSSVPVEKFDLAKNGSFLISAGNGNAAYLWDLNEGRVVSSFSSLGGLVTDLDVSNDDKQVVISLNNGLIKVFAIPTAAEYSTAKVPLATMQGLNETVRSIAFSPDQNAVASGNWRDGLKVWNAKTGEEIFTLGDHMRAINKIYFSPDGKWLVTGHEDNVVRVWEVQSAQEIYHFEGYLPKGLPFSPDNRFLTIMRTPKERYKLDTIEIVELGSGNIVAELPDYDPKSLVQFTADSKLLIAGNMHTANIWDVSTWERINMHGGMNAGCGQYFTPENVRLAVIYDTGVLFSYDKKIQDLCSKKPEGTTLVYYFKDKHEVFFVLGDGRVWSWDFLSPEIANIHFSAPYPFPDDIFLAADQMSGWYAYAVEGTVALQRESQSQPSLTIPNQDDYRFKVALLPSLKLVALGSQYGSIHIWTMP